MKRTLLSLILLLLPFGMTKAQQPTSIVTAVPFLLINPDARGAGLADCGVASEADVFSIYYNPAKYAYLQKPTAIGASYNHWTMGKDNQFHFAAAQQPAPVSITDASIWNNPFH